MKTNGFKEKSLATVLTILLCIGMIQPIFANHYFNILGTPLKWNHTNFLFYTPKNIELIQDALNVISWRTNNTFTFTYTGVKNQADITYEFNKKPMDQSEAYGYTNYLSSERIIHHAYITLDARLKPQGVYYVAIHESLHALGLNHSTEPNSIMNPPWAKGKVITDTDIEHLIMLYLQPKMSLPTTFSDNIQNDNNVVGNCEDIDWILCWYVQGRINDGWQEYADLTLEQYDLVNNCGTYMIKTPTHNITPYELRIAFWNGDKVVSLVKMNITSWMEYTLCTSQHQDGITAGLY